MGGVYARDKNPYGFLNSRQCLDFILPFLLVSLEFEQNEFKLK